MTIDIGHKWGADLDVGPTGDLAVVEQSLKGEQRILRRLLTNPGDYIWALNYGAGLSRFVGDPSAEGRIQAVIRSQMALESSVSRYPNVSVRFKNTTESQVGIFYADVTYSESVDGASNTVSIPVTE